MRPLREDELFPAAKAAQPRSFIHSVQTH